jgi:GNAT superfamily N-acetyltransferase
MAVIRLGLPADLPMLVRYWHAMLVECDLIGSGLVSDWAQRLERQFRADMEAGSGTWAIAEDAGTFAGTCAIFLQLGRSNIMLDATAMLAGMYVVPRYRRRGVASELTKYAIQWCRDHGCKRIRLQASVQGRPIYESLGFVTATEMMRLDLR